MKKIKFKSLHAFSITELIVTMLILCLVAIASTPLFTMRRASSATNHGRFVCWAEYDAQHRAWTVQGEQFDSKGESDRGRSNCNFEIPAGVETFNVTAIGGGGGGTASRPGQIVRVWDKENRANEVFNYLYGGNSFGITNANGEKDASGNLKQDGITLKFELVGGGAGGGSKTGEIGSNASVLEFTTAIASGDKITSMQIGSPGQFNSNGGNTQIKVGDTTYIAKGGLSYDSYEARINAGDEYLGLCNSAGSCSTVTCGLANNATATANNLLVNNSTLSCKNGFGDNGEGAGGDVGQQGKKGVISIFYKDIKIGDTFSKYQMSEILSGDSTKINQGRPLGGEAGERSVYVLRRANLAACGGRIRFVASGAGDPGMACYGEIGVGGAGGYARDCGPGETSDTDNCGDVRGVRGGDTTMHFGPGTFDSSVPANGGAGGKFGDYKSNTGDIPADSGKKVLGDYGKGGDSGATTINLNGNDLIFDRQFVEFRNFNTNEAIVVQDGANPNQIIDDANYTVFNGQEGRGGVIIIEW